MKTKAHKHRELSPGGRRYGLLYGTASLLSLLVIAGFWLVATAGRDKTPDYLSYDLSRPWFDGLQWDWFLDMVNMPHLKPQEEGTIQTFPHESVPRSGREPFIAANAVAGGHLLRDIQPQDTFPRSQLSIARGKNFYGIYCAACHGSDGYANTVVTNLGMPAPVLHSLLPLLSDAHIYNLIRYGGGIMPSYGHQTSQKDRWDIVHYLRSSGFQQLSPSP